MFNIGAGEMLVIMLVALIVLGPQKLPDAARKVGNVMGEMRRLSSGFQTEMRNALDDAERSEQPTGTLQPATPPEQAAADALAASDVPASDAAGAEGAPGDAPPDETSATVANRRRVARRRRVSRRRRVAAVERADEPTPHPAP
ncbi:hypothetical protein BH18ACT4_BH18ACT4_06070 [soil metagenome]